VVFVDTAFPTPDNAVEDDLTGEPLGDRGDDLREVPGEAALLPGQAAGVLRAGSSCSPE
jgi:hypothetical protein